MRVEVQGLLLDLAPALEIAVLARDLRLEAALEEPERVHVLDFGLHAQGGLADRRIETLASTRREPSSMFTSDTPAPQGAWSA